MFDKFINVSEIMREIKSGSKSSIVPDGRFFPESKEDDKGFYHEEIEKRDNELLEYRGLIEHHKVIGNKTPQFLKFGKIKRIILKIAAKIINKAAFIITRDQNVVNNYVLLSIDRLREDISLITNWNSENNYKNKLIESETQNLQSILDVLNKTYENDKKEVLEVSTNEKKNISEQFKNEKKEMIEKFENEKKEMIEKFENEKKEMIEKFENEKDQIIKELEKVKMEFIDIKENILLTQNDTKKAISRMQRGIYYSNSTDSNYDLNMSRDNKNSEIISFDNERFYSDFEDKFRGSEVDIKLRMSKYINLINEYSKLQIIDCLDIGCGRGEFLELLRENGFKATGVDINREFVSICQGKGLDVHKVDALNYLKTLDENSLDLITGFQIIEHIEFGELNLIISECRRVLKENGLLIFETPNPQNLMVGSCNFYLDNTHIRPVHPERIKFQMESLGFYNIQYFYWDNNVIEYKENMKNNIISSQEFSESIKGMLLLANDWLNAPPDYAIIGGKA